MATFEELGKVDRSIGIEYEDPRLLRQHKIFLSHSGVQKEFVEQLCVDLESYCRFPFFDKRPSSLPKGERFPNLIKAVVAQCEMMVVVVSNTYFTSKWPMIELHGFKQASKGKENLKKILPLFYGLNVDEFFDTKRQEKWFKKWETMAIADDRIKVGEWKECLKWFGGFNGIVYDRHSKEVVAYRKEIVSNICKAIPPDIKYDESHVQGRSKLCQVICGFFGNTPNSTKIPGVRVIGLYGLGGMGKTETCKMMCNEMDGEFDGKVCYLELGKTSKHELVKKLLTTLTTTIAEVVQEVGEDKCRDVLLENKVWKQKSFLTIDNVWDDPDSLEQGKLCLQAPFVEGSWVIITSRFKKTLISLNVDEITCFEMPELDKDDARNMFLYYATNGKEFENTEDVHAIEECIKSCYFGKGEGRGSHYHPLSLKALGDYLHCRGKEPSMWMKDLEKLRESNFLQYPIKGLFNNLRSNFDRLPKWEQELFMDVAMFFPTSTPDFNLDLTFSPRSVYDFLDCMCDFKPDLMEWLCLVHNKEKEEIENWLRRLVDSALLEHAEMSSGEVSIHDLYLEFAGLEAQGKLIALDMEKRRWVYAKDAHPTELVEEPKSSWNMLTRVCISDAYRMMKKSGITSLRAIKWKYFTNLVVLKLDDLYELSEVLNFKDLIRLRSLIVKTSVFSLFNFSIEGLEGLKTLNYFKMHCGGEDTKAYVGKLPAALKVLVVSGSVVLVRDVFDLCTNLVSLKLGSVYTSDLDLRSCTSLQKVELIKIHGLGTLDLVPSIQSLNISCCPKLSQVCGLKRLAGLLSLVVIGNEKLLLLSNFPVRTLECVGLESLTISDCPELSTLPRLTSIQCLRELEISRVGLTKIPNLSGLEQLEVIDASRNSELTSLQGIGDLRALKTINLSSCESLFRLSDMSKLTNLKVLDLRFTRVELQEEDIHMLEKLQVLEPVLVARPPRNRIVPTFGLDFKRHKILYLLSESFENYEGWQTCKKSGWEEKDLHYPFGAGYPVGRGIKIRNVENLWRLIPGPVIKIVGPDGKH